MKKPVESLSYYGTLSIAFGIMTKAFEPLMKDSFMMSLPLFVIGAVAIGMDFIKFDTPIEKTLLICGLKKEYEETVYNPKLIKTEKTEDKKIYHFSLPVGMCLSDFEHKKEQIEQALNKKIELQYQDNKILMSVNEKQLADTYEFEQRELRGALEIIVGHTLNNIITIDLATSASPHLGVYGETNSGKSVILRNILTQLILNKKPSELELHLIDLKRVELSVFKKCEIVKSFSNDEEQASKVLSDICKMTDNRYKLLEEKECVNIVGYNKKVKKKLPYVLLVIDEFADLSDNKDTIEDLFYIARKSRAVGIHLIISTQRPDKDVLNSRVKANIGNVIGLKTVTGINSQIIIDQYGAEKLKGKGHGLFKCNGEVTEFQSEYISEVEATKLIKHTFKQKEDMQIARVIPITPKIELETQKIRGRVKC